VNFYSETFSQSLLQFLDRGFGPAGSHSLKHAPSGEAPRGRRKEQGLFLYDGCGQNGVDTATLRPLGLRLQIRDNDGPHHVPHAVEGSVSHIEESINAAHDGGDLEGEVERLDEDEGDH
jgi:hypothetical protein